jgi:DNA primase
MGTALNERHIKTLKKVVNRVVLVFDADAGGVTGVDRAMQVFVTHDLDLRIATLPDGLDPCDLLSTRGPEPFRQALEKAVDVFEYKLYQTWAKHASNGLDGKRIASEEMLAILALSPNERSVKLDLMVNRIAHRLQIKEETLWARLKDLRRNRKDADARETGRSGEEPAPPPSEEPRAAKAMPHERELVEVLLAEPSLVPRSAVEIPPAEMEHPGLRKVIEALYRLHAQGQTADLDHLQGAIDDRLWNRLHDLQEAGFDYPDRTAVYQNILKRFRERQDTRSKLALKNQLQTADPASSLELLKRLRDQK